MRPNSHRFPCRLQHENGTSRSGVDALASTPPGSADSVASATSIGALIRLQLARHREGSRVRQQSRLATNTTSKMKKLPLLLHARPKEAESAWRVPESVPTRPLNSNEAFTTKRRRVAVRAS